MCCYCCLFGQVDWGHTWEELTEPLQANARGLYVPLRTPKKVLGLFTSSESGKLVLIDSQEKCEVRSPRLNQSPKRQTQTEQLFCLYFFPLSSHFHLFLSIVHFSFGATGYCGNVFILQTDDTQESGEVDEFVVDVAADWKGDKGQHFFGNIWSSISYSLSAGLGNIRRYGMTNEWTHASSGEKFNEEIRSEPSADARLVKKSSGSLPPRSHPGTSGTAPFKEQKKKKFQHYIFFVIGPCPLFSVGHFSLAGRGVKQKER